MPSGRFRIFLIKPSHYDDDGYVIQWRLSTIPSNSLAVVASLIADAGHREVLGPDLAIRCTAIDETNTRVDVEAIAGAIEAEAGGFVGLVGVQSNQFPRAMDLARAFRAHNIAVIIGGFHVSGSLAMLPGIQPDLQEALDLGVTLFAGEAEGRLDQLLRDAAAGALKPIYRGAEELPALEGAPIPYLPRALLERSIGVQTSFDAGRGCPFRCSFCTIINVQGRKSRHRAVEDIERVIRANWAQGVTSYFISDDNFARNKHWEAIFNRIIVLRERDGIKITFTLQVDTLCHKLPGFIDKAARAGATKVFIGLENINPDALQAAQKKQNRIGDYRAMMQAWHSAKVIIFAGYIIGFPNDTPASILRDVAIIQRELPVDFLEFFVLTPLPGSQDHQEMFARGAPMEPDLNKYDLFHVCADHAVMSREAWAAVYRQAWDAYYTPAHIETLFRRAHAAGIPVRDMLRMVVWFLGTIAIEKLHPLEGGYLRRKVRRDRRPERAREGVLTFYPRLWMETLTKHLRAAAMIWKYLEIERRVLKDPEGARYTDLALTPPSQDDRETLELFTHTKPADERHVA